VKDYGSIPRDYVMNPNEEDIVPTGGELRDGMVIVLEAKNMREWSDLDEFYPERNNWCEVSQIRYMNDRVYFTGTYADGIKRRRDYQSMTAYLVKLETIPEPKDPVDTEIVAVEMTQERIATGEIHVFVKGQDGNTTRIIVDPAILQ